MAETGELSGENNALQFDGAPVEFALHNYLFSTARNIFQQDYLHSQKLHLQQRLWYSIPGDNTV